VEAAGVEYRRGLFVVVRDDKFSRVTIGDCAGLKFCLSSLKTHHHAPSGNFFVPSCPVNDRGEGVAVTGRAMEGTTDSYARNFSQKGISPAGRKGKGFAGTFPGGAPKGIAVRDTQTESLTVRLSAIARISSFAKEVGFTGRTADVTSGWHELPAGDITKKLVEFMAQVGQVGLSS
jgi:hypothetical protein